ALGQIITDRAVSPVSAAPRNPEVTAGLLPGGAGLTPVADEPTLPLAGSGQMTPNTHPQAAAGGDSGRCAQTGAFPYQPRLEELNTALERAAAGQLGPAYPQMGTIPAGWPNLVEVPATIPCVLLKAIASVESDWHQAEYATPRGSSGYPLMPPNGCAYGVGQIATGMQQPGEIDRTLQYRIAHDYVTNAAYSAKLLAEKWRITPAIGSNDPAIAEDWYYAVWAYNTFSWINNPNNPRWDPSRPPFTGRPTDFHYPYQELVWGFAANPPAPGGAPLWTAVPLTLPDRSSFPTNPDTPPGRVSNDPQPVHSSTCPAVTIAGAFMPWVARSAP
ncbi:MAG TPA: hypothetical protein VHL09_11880, partial [Dehalococcoidia bacterium]|nr:hypothetical protein [Dehalococcoidia bacterium]